MNLNHHVPPSTQPAARPPRTSAQAKLRSNSSPPSHERKSKNVLSRHSRNSNVCDTGLAAPESAATASCCRKICILIMTKSFERGFIDQDQFERF
jgi:hypothetical protein